MSQNTQSLYKSALMDHFKKPRHKHQGPFDDSMAVGRGSNPACGDDIEVGLDFATSEVGSVLQPVEFRGRGCSVCLASASMMTEATNGLEPAAAVELAHTIEQWVAKKLSDESSIPELLHPLAAVKDHPARKKCVMLAWNALSQAIQQKLSEEA